MKIKVKKKFICLAIIVICICILIATCIINRQKIYNLYQNIFVGESMRSKFDLREKINIKAEYQNQATYRSCYAFAGLDMIETNLMLNKNINYDFSESHVEYLTSTLFGGKRQMDTFGFIEDVLEYVNNGKGPVLQSEFSNKKYSEDEYDELTNIKPIIKNVESIKFEYNSQNFRQNIKNHIVKNGSISADIYFIPDNYNEKTRGFSNIRSDIISHVVSIIGWDDNYSKENFVDDEKPKNDGAYIALSFFNKLGGDYEIYISYEDITVEKNMIGITNAEIY